MSNHFIQTNNVVIQPPAYLTDIKTSLFTAGQKEFEIGKNSSSSLVFTNDEIKSNKPLTPLSTQTTMQVEIFLGVILGLYDPLWHVEWPTKVHEGSGGVLDGLSAVGGALRGFQRPFSR